ncbi:hypothetical protein MCC93_19920 [Morococcus cerebrosus]|uniref:Uncharacterized protein n=1 Tax=Morococcus cerebrosus TaxID=1056807 RepID=A0A0C1ECN0_9NEIS|nr:hypothetical protein MCC93_19920 [Morococcus cerebrosus]
MRVCFIVSDDLSIREIRGRSPRYGFVAVEFKPLQNNIRSSENRFQTTFSLFYFTVDSNQNKP